MGTAIKAANSKLYNNRRILVLASAVILFFFKAVPATASENKADSVVEKEVKIVLERFVEAYKNKNIKEMMSLYLDSPQAIALGNTERQKSIGPEKIEQQYRQNFSSYDDIKNVEYKIISISSSGEIAWMAAEIVTSIEVQGNAVDLRGRMTAVLKTQNTKWFFVQTHFSFPHNPFDGPAVDKAKSGDNSKPVFPEM